MPAILLRLPADLHHLIRLAAATKGLSVTAWALAQLRGAVLRQAREPDGAPIAAALDELVLEQKPGKDMA